MTIRRDPDSAQGAWWETGRALVWEELVEEIKRERGIENLSVSTVKGWADPDNHPPLWAVEIADRALKRERLPPYNTIALGVRIGGQSPDIEQRLDELDHRQDAVIKLIEASRDGEWDWLGVADVASRMAGRLTDLVRHACKRRAKLEEDRRRPRIVSSMMVDGMLVLAGFSQGF